MTPGDILRDAAFRPADTADVVLDGLGPDAAHDRLLGRGNSIAWLLWHAARQMDVQTVDLAGGETVWRSGGWAERLGVDRGPDEFGLGDTGEDVAALRVADLPALGAHLRACVEALVAYVDGLDDANLDEVVDDAYDPPVTRGARIVSIIDDAAVHAGQAAYVRGLLDGWSIGV